MRRSGKGPQFIRFFRPILKVLGTTGGSGTPSEVIDRVIEMLRIPDSEQKTTLKNGQSRVRNQVQWARLYLVRTGFLDASRRGVWSLTEKGMSTNPHTLDELTVFQSVVKVFREEKRRKDAREPLVDELDEPEVSATDYKVELLNLIKGMPPGGFERLCQRLLRESGFQQVLVTGRTGDGGIDGVGVWTGRCF